MNHEIDLVTRGNPVMDILYTDHGKMYEPGGSASTTAAAASKLGLRSGIVGTVGDDEYGRELREDLDMLGVDTSRLLSSGVASRLNHIRVTGNDREIFDATNPSDRREMSIEDYDYISNARSFFLRVRNEAFGGFLEFCEREDRELFASLQHHTGAKEYSPGHLYSPAVKIIFANEHEVEEWITKIEGKIVAVTLGKDGCDIHYNGNKNHYPAFGVDAVDPTGAGDMFAGAFIYGHLNDWPIDKTARIANYMGALATTAYGARGILHHISREDIFQPIGGNKVFI